MPCDPCSNMHSIPGPVAETQSYMVPVSRIGKPQVTVPGCQNKTNITLKFWAYLPFTEPSRFSVGSLTLTRVEIRGLGSCSDAKLFAGTMQSAKPGFGYTSLPILGKRNLLTKTLRSKPKPGMEYETELPATFGLAGQNRGSREVYFRRRKANA